MRVEELIEKLLEMPPTATIELISLVDQSVPIGNIYYALGIVYIEIEDMR